DDDGEDDPDIALTAIIQKRLKSGSWNKGRVAPVQSIMQGKAADIVSALSDADQAIIATCREPRSRYNSNNEFLTTKKTWPALVGRDNVYLNDPTGAPLVISAMRPQVKHE